MAEETIQGGTMEDYAEYAKSLAVDIPEITWKDVGNVALDFTPIIGDIKGGYETVQMIGDELSKEDPNYYMIGALGGLGAAATIIGLVPGVGDVAKTAIMAGARRVAQGASDVGRGALEFVDRIEVDPNTLGALGGNVRLKPKVTGVVDVGDGVYKSVDDLTDELGGNVMQQGLRYSDDASTNAIIKNYLQNQNRGSALTKGGYVEDTSLGRMKVARGTVPLQEMGSEIDFSTRVQTQPEPFDYQKAIDEGAQFMSIKGDRASGTGSILSVNDIPLVNPVAREGGYEYATEAGNLLDNRMYASDPSILERQRRKAEALSGQVKDPKTGEILKEGVPVYGTFFNAAGDNVNFNTMVADTTLNMIPNMKITKKAAKQFDEKLRERIPDWPGLGKMEASDLEKAKEYLFAPNRGEARKAFSEEMAKPRSMKLGFPDQASVRAAVSKADMLGMGSGDATGRMIAQIDYNAPIDPISNHMTYPSGLKRVEGTPVYRMADERGNFRDVPTGMFFNRFYDDRIIDDVVPPEATTIRSMELRQADQPATKELNDIIQEYLYQTDNTRRGYPYNR